MDEDLQTPFVNKPLMIAEAIFPAPIKPTVLESILAKDYQLVSLLFVPVALSYGLNRIPWIGYLNLSHGSEGSDLDFII